MSDDIHTCSYYCDRPACIKAQRDALVRTIESTSDTTAQLIALLRQRDAAGRAKYGTTLDRTDLSIEEWLQHMAEEMLDGAGYALAAMREIERLRTELAALRDAARGLRFDHYEATTPELRQFFGRRTVAVVQPDSMDRLQAALDKA